MINEDVERECTRCEKVKPLSEFNLVSKSRPYPRSVCKSCESEINRGWRQEHRLQRQEDANQYYAEHKEEIIAQMRDSRHALKHEVIQAYGGKCECCGEDHEQLLTIDHIENDGAAHRRSLTLQPGAASRKLYRFLRDNGFPKEGYRCLCYNCNLGRALYGKCPHGNGI